MLEPSRASLAIALLAGSCCISTACSQAETGAQGSAGQPSSGAGNAHGGTSADTGGSAGAPSDSGSSAGGIGTQAGTSAGGNSAAGAASAGTAGSGATAGSGGLFGGEAGKFPTLHLPVALPAAPPAAACPAGSVLQKVGSPTLHSWPGTVFGSAALTGQGENHAPTKLQVQVTKQGQAVAGCEVRFRAAADNGWGFGASRVTDQQGNLYGYWTAGKVGQNSISAVIALEGGGESTAVFTGNVAAHESRTDSVHLYYDVDASYTEFKVRITPLTAPPATYYSALNWQDSYAGIQFDGDTTTVIFSVWDAGGEKAKIADEGACNALVGFGGEGTGTSCRLKFPPAKQGAIAGLPDDYRLEPGNTYELHLSMTPSPSGGTAHTLTFTDLTRGLGPISVGTQTTGTPFDGGGHASSFVEEWTEHGDCLSNSRAVLYHGQRAKVGGSWQDVTSAAFSPNYVTTNNEVCGNYLARELDGTFLMSSGGKDYVGRPFVPGDSAFKKPFASLQIQP
jgi:hypothetical protein